MVAGIERVETVSMLVDELFVDVAVRIWEPENAKGSVTCLHGFSGNSNDFAPLAETLVASGLAVIAPDMFGRGKSTFFLDPRRYTLRTQLLAVNACRRYQKSANCYLGTSFGGLMALAYITSTSWQTRGIFLNDSPINSNAHVAGYRSQLIEEAEKFFATRDEAEFHLISSRSMEFLTGPMRERFVESRLLETNSGWRMNYDPTLAETLRAQTKFSVEELIKKAPKPILMSFGSDSPYADDPLNDEVAAANPNVVLLKSMSGPHPPSLMKPDHIYTVAGFIGRCLG